MNLRQEYSILLLDHKFPRAIMFHCFCFFKVIKFTSHLHFWYKAYDGRWVGNSTIEQVSIDDLNCNKRFESFRVKFEMKKGSISNQIQSHLPMWSFLVKSPKVKLYLFYFCKPFLQKLFIKKLFEVIFIDSIESKTVLNVLNN
jgi:hypothetical protein